MPPPPPRHAIHECTKLFGKGGAKEKGRIPFQTLDDKQKKKVLAYKSLGAVSLLTNKNKKKEKKGLHVQSLISD